MKPLPTYENDLYVSNLLASDVTKEKLLALFYKKGIVNFNNLSYLSSSNFGKEILELENEGLIKPYGSHCYKITMKARWIKFRDSKDIWWLIAIITLIIALLAWLRPIKL